MQCDVVRRYSSKSTCHLLLFSTKFAVEIFLFVDKILKGKDPKFVLSHHRFNWQFLRSHFSLNIVSFCISKIPGEISYPNDSYGDQNHDIYFAETNLKLSF